VELRSQLYRLISIMKMRESQYDSGIREFSISDEGIQVADTFESAENILTGHAHVRNGDKEKDVSAPMGGSGAKKKAKKGLLRRRRS
jgi:circadian clock protein KaiC